MKHTFSEHCIYVYIPSIGRPVLDAGLNGTSLEHDPSTEPSRTF
jgi:hypothetical protein